MKSAEFASHYPRFSVLPPEEDQSHFATSQRWAAVFGTHIHRLLSNENPESLEVDGYVNWMRTDYVAMEQRLFQKKGGKEAISHAAHRLNELNFHVLNSGMMPLWFTSHLGVDTQKDKNDRLRAITLAQGSLAISALDLYKFRQDRLKTGEYYLEAYEPMQKMIQGRLTELDAGVTLLSYIKNKHLAYNLYAAPAQFEHSKIPANNTDFILTNPQEQQLVGIQIKSSVHDEDVARYDKDKIILIDGRIDLGGERKIAIDKRSSPSLRAWGGMVAVSHLRDMSPKERKILIAALQISEKYLMSDIFLARSLLAGIRSHNEAANQKVAIRTENYFSAQQAA